MQERQISQASSAEQAGRQAGEFWQAWQSMQEGRQRKGGRHDGSAGYAVRAGHAVPTVQARQAVFKVRSDRQGRQASRQA
jgi:hypothetical protein